ncbi:MAG: hypothetical protein RSG50_05615 [Clostridia bacterium]
MESNFFIENALLKIIIYVNYTAIIAICQPVILDKWFEFLLNSFSNRNIFNTPRPRQFEKQGFPAHRRLRGAAIAAGI